MNRNIVITGANRGIGLALTQLYAKSGDVVYAVCRNSSAELRELSGIKIVSGIDVTNASDVLQLQTKLRDVKVDILINNAGILADDTIGNIDFNSAQQQFLVNALAPLRVTENLLGTLTAGSKIVLITSRMGSMSDNSSGGHYGYRMSKAALNAAGMSLALDLKPRDIDVGILHPGFVKTALVGNQGDIDATEAATRLKLRIEALNSKNTGFFKHANGEVLPW
jgi:NAD(P)-dependent dehydrogenase (short-subunit alcohol dehydrogenase family)